MLCPIFLFPLATPVSRMQFHTQPAASQVPPSSVRRLPAPEIASILYDIRWLRRGQTDGLSDCQKSWTLIKITMTFIHGRRQNKLGVGSRFWSRNTCRPKPRPGFINEDYEFQISQIKNFFQNGEMYIFSFLVSRGKISALI